VRSLTTMSNQPQIDEYLALADVTLHHYPSYAVPVHAGHARHSRRAATGRINARSARRLGLRADLFTLNCKGKLDKQLKRELEELG
jgi:hypothetical protein